VINVWLLVLVSWALGTGRADSNSPENWGEALGGKTGDDASVSSANPVCSLVWEGEVVRSSTIPIRVLFEASTYPYKNMVISMGLC